MELTSLVSASQQGDLKAYTKLIRQTQHLALGYALSLLDDHARAQDVVQDAYLTAFKRLPTLQKPTSFPAWLRSIVYFGCQRVFRSRRSLWLPLEDLLQTTDPEKDAPQLLHRQQEQESLWKALKALPRQQRTVLTLYYLEEHSQQEVADFLEMSVTQVNNALYQARQRLKRRLQAMEMFEEHRLTPDFADTIGHILKAQGLWVEATVAPRQQPQVLDLLQPVSSEDSAPLLVVQRLQGGRLRCLATTEALPPRTPLKAGGEVGYLPRPLEEERWQDALRAFRAPTEAPRLLHTGIKALDLFCPLRDGDTVGIFGREGVGRAVLVMEMLKQQSHLQGHLSLLFFVDQWNALGTQEFLQQEPAFASDLHERIDTAWLVHPRAGDPVYARECEALKARLFFSPLMAVRQLWPALDPLYSTSEALCPDVVGKRHFALAQESLRLLRQLREWTADPVWLESLALGHKTNARERWENLWKQTLHRLAPEQQKEAKRARRLEAYLTQPFAVAEDFTGMPGVLVSKDALLNDVEALIRGDWDTLEWKRVMWQGSLKSEVTD
jgi:RNA polymerase sigma factor (sigma-70 family)